MKTFALLSTAALLAAHETAAQLDAGAAQCEAQLVAMSSAMNVCMLFISTVDQPIERVTIQALDCC